MHRVPKYIFYRRNSLKSSQWICNPSSFYKFRIKVSVFVTFLRIWGRLSKSRKHQYLDSIALLNKIWLQTARRINTWPMCSYFTLPLTSNEPGKLLWMDLDKSLRFTYMQCYTSLILLAQKFSDIGSQDSNSLWQHCWPKSYRSVLQLREICPLLDSLFYSHLSINSFGHTHPPCISPAGLPGMLAPSFMTSPPTHTV